MSSPTPEHPTLLQIQIALQQHLMELPPNEGIPKPDFMRKLVDALHDLYPDQCNALILKGPPEEPSVNDQGAWIRWYRAKHLCGLKAGFDAYKARLDSPNI